MVISLPKIPKYGWGGSCCDKSQTPRLISNPNWIRKEDGYQDLVYDMGVINPQMVMVEYIRDSHAKEMKGDFSRIYVLGEDGTPVPYMDGLWKELSWKSANGLLGFEMDNEGRMFHKKNRIRANDKHVYPILDCAKEIYQTWNHYPTAKDFGTAQKLVDAKLAIDKLKNEETHGWIASQIKDAQGSMEALRNRIAKHEKELNQIYEDAADAMNLFEENGIDPNLVDDETSKNDIVAPWVDAIDDILSGLNFIGTARISKNSNGSLNVYGHTNPQRGNLVFDPSSGTQAVYNGGGKWVAIS